MEVTPAFKDVSLLLLLLPDRHTKLLGMQLRALLTPGKHLAGGSHLLISILIVSQSPHSSQSH